MTVRLILDTLGLKTSNKMDADGKCSGKRPSGISVDSAQTEENNHNSESERNRRSRVSVTESEGDGQCRERTDPDHMPPVPEIARCHGNCGEDYSEDVDEHRNGLPKTYEKRRHVEGLHPLVHFPRGANRIRTLAILWRHSNGAVVENRLACDSCVGSGVRGLTPPTCAIDLWALSPAVLAFVLAATGFGGVIFG